MGPGALRRRVLAAHNAAMEGATAAADGSLQISVASDFADSSMADSSRDVSPNARNSKKSASRTHMHRGNRSCCCERLRRPFRAGMRTLWLHAIMDVRWSTHR